jgi:RNA polymerase sigma-70 factor (ECF subfamily)
LEAFSIFTGVEIDVMTPEMALSPRIEFGDNAVMRHSSRDESISTVGIEAEGLADLIARSREGDPTAMEEIYRRFKTALFNLAFRYSYDRATAEDLLQEIFIKVFTHLNDVKNPDTFPGWVFRIGLNTCYSHLRSRRPEMEKGVPLEHIEGTIHGATGENPAGDARKPLDDGIASLPAKLREIFLLHDVQGFKHEEIARLLGLSVGTSKSQLFKARLRMRAYLTNKGVC